MSERRLRIAVVTAWPTEDWHSERLLLACQELGEAEFVDPGDLAALVRHGELHLRAGSDEAGAFDAFVLARGMSPRGDPDVQFALYRALEETGAVVANRIGPLLDAQDKFRGSFLLKRAGVPTPRAGVAQTPEDAQQLLRLLGEAVLKPVAGSLGEGIERVRPDEAGLRRAAERVDEEGALYLQRYVPNDGRDARVFVVGGVAVAGVERIAPRGEWRTNVALGAEVRPLVMSKALVTAAERAARALALDYTGVDLIDTPEGPQVIEVNGNPSFDFIYDATGDDMSRHIARYVAKKADARRSRRARLGRVLPLELEAGLGG